MPFPHVNKTDVQNEYALVENETDANNIMRAVNRLATNFKIVDKTPVKAAAVVYLGLCRLKDYSDRDEQNAGSSHCAKLLNTLRVVNGRGVSLNCSYFLGKKMPDKRMAHEDAIKRACNVYLPRIKSRKKRCLVLLALGAEHESRTLPPDDSWLAEYEF